MNGTEMTRFHAPEPRKRHAALTAFLVVLAVLIAAFGIVAGLVFSDPLEGKGYEKLTPSDGLAKTFAESVVKQSECSFSKNEINGYLSYLFQKHDVGAEKRGLKLLSAAVTEGSGDSANLYLPTEYYDKRFGVLLNITPSLDQSNGRLLFRVNGAHVGRMPVSPEWLLQKVKSRLPDGFLLDKNTVSCKSPAVSVSILTVTASANLREFKMENGTLKTAAALQISVG